MATPAKGPLLSLRPFPVADKKPKNLAEFIARVNAQPGGFRAVTEAKLKAEIKAREESNGESGNEDVDMSDAGAEDGDDAAAKDPNLARNEVLKNIDIASNTAMLTLDSISLLLSKQNPTQASLTLSQQLREMVGIGTMGADKLDDSNTTPEKIKDQEDVALGWTLMEINKTRDAAEEASRFLETEMEAEGRYWEDVLAVKKAGWSICKVPKERHTLGVRFGFSEAGPEFKNNGLAPMRRGDDGSVQLDCGRLGGVSERLVVTYEKDGQVVGRSTPRTHAANNTSLESRVLEARNTIFSQELWHELSREARSLAAYDVRIEGSQLTCAIVPASRIVVELMPVEACSDVPEEGEGNVMADSISVALHVLLSYSHRYNELLRTRPIPPHISRSRGQTIYTLLRPIIARMKFMRSIDSCAQYVGRLTKTLAAAGLPASFTLHTQQLSLNEGGPKGPNQPSTAQTLVRNMMQPQEFLIKLAILPDASLSIRGRTFMFPVTATHYHVLNPSASLQKACAPYPDGYPDIRALSYYLRTATARLLTENFLAKLSLASEKSTWALAMEGTTIRDTAREDLSLRFAVEDTELNPSLVLTCSSSVNKKIEYRTWSWGTETDKSETRSLEDVVDETTAEKLS